MRKYLIVGSMLAGLAAAPALAEVNVSVTGASAAAVSAQDAPSPQRINRAIELLEQGQPVYYTTVRGGAGYDEGREMAGTAADYITYEMEHGSLDFTALRDFMRGLVDAGPTRTGHRTPAVIATLPILGEDPVSMKANAWVVQQALAAGVHGILLCHAEDPDAIELFVEASRYPFAPGANQDVSHRGAGSQGFASQIWGVEPQEYMDLADTWPLNPDGEILLGLKIETPRGTVNAEALTAVPGIGFAEWGPSDQSYYLFGRPDGARRDDAPEMVETRARVLAATQAAEIYFLNSCPEDDVINQIEDGTMICTGGESPAAEIGRAHTNRQGPW